MQREFRLDRGGTLSPSRRRQKHYANPAPPTLSGTVRHRAKTSKNRSRRRPLARWQAAFMLPPILRLGGVRARHCQQRRHDLMIVATVRAKLVFMALGWARLGGGMRVNRRSDAPKEWAQRVIRGDAFATRLAQEGDLASADDGVPSGAGELVSGRASRCGPEPPDAAEFAGLGAGRAASTATVQSLSRELATRSSGCRPQSVQWSCAGRLRARVVGRASARSATGRAGLAATRSNPVPSTGYRRVQARTRCHDRALPAIGLPGLCPVLVSTRTLSAVQGAGLRTLHDGIALGAAA